MTQLRDCKGGDVGDFRLVGLRGDNDEPVDLTAVTAVVATVQRQGIVQTLVAAVEGTATEGVIKVELGTAGGEWLPARPDPGKWDIEYQLTYSDGTTLTFPGESRDTIRVWYDLNGP